MCSLLAVVLFPSTSSLQASGSRRSRRAPPAEDPAGVRRSARDAAPPSADSVEMAPPAADGRPTQARSGESAAAQSGTVSEEAERPPQPAAGLPGCGASARAPISAAGRQEMVLNQWSLLDRDWQSVARLERVRRLYYRRCSLSTRNPWYCQVAPPQDS